MNLTPLFPCNNVFVCSVDSLGLVALNQCSPCVKKKTLVGHLLIEKNVVRDMIAEIKSEGSNDLLYMRIHVSGEKLNASVDSLMLNESDDCDLISSAEVRWHLEQECNRPPTLTCVVNF